jgi:hypothetical protein
MLFLPLKGHVPPCANVPLDAYGDACAVEISLLHMRACAFRSKFSAFVVGLYRLYHRGYPCSSLAHYSYVFDWRHSEEICSEN